MPLRLIFMGTPDFAVPTLRALAESGHDIAAVYTRVAKPSGRGMKLTPTPVAREAERLGVQVLTPKTLRTPEVQDAFRAHRADAAVVVAYGMILPPAILDTPKLGCYNLHASLLPRWRGAAPINRAIMAGDSKTGVMVIKMDAGLDTGDVCKTKLRHTFYIRNSTTAGYLGSELAKMGSELIIDSVAKLQRSRLNMAPQSSEKATYASKIDKAEARINFMLPALDVLHQIHGISPFPGAWCEVSVGDEIVRLKLTLCETVRASGVPGELLDDRMTIACGSGAIRVLQLQRAGKAAMSAQEFLRGTNLPRGARTL